MKIAIAALLAGALLAAASSFPDAQAQAYPSKSIRLIRPHPAGSPGDVQARGVAQALSQSYGQAIVVENRVGAEGIIGAEACAKAPADGYTLCGTESYVISVNPVVRTALPYDPARDFAPIINLGFTSSLLLVHPSVPARSVAELLALAKAKPGSVSWGSWGTSSSSNFYIEWLKNAAGVVFMNVPYKSATQAVQAAISGEIHVAVYAVGLGMPMVKTGKLRALAVTSAQRSAFAPELPSFKESSIDVSIQAWWGWFAPAATPKEIVQRLNADIARLYADSAFREKYGPGLGFELIGPALRSSEEFAAYLVGEREMYARLVKLAGVKPQ